MRRGDAKEWSRQLEQVETPLIVLLKEFCAVPNVSSQALMEQLGTDAVHVWQSPTDGVPCTSGDVGDTLSQDEMCRANRFIFDVDRHRYVSVRTLLRALLGLYLGVHPRQVAFSYGEFGKPRLSSAFNSQLTFNVSHSDGNSLIAIALDREVGVDLEHVRVDFEYEDVMEALFTKREIVMLSGVPASARRRWFYRLWTRKEALLKAMGLGFSGNTAKDDCVLIGDGKASHVDCTLECDHYVWEVRNLDVGASYEAAVVVGLGSCTARL